MKLKAHLFFVISFLVPIFNSTVMYSQETWDLLWLGRIEEQGIHSVDISSAGNKVLASSYSGCIRVWNTKTGAVIWTDCNNKQSLIACFSPDGSRVAVSTNNDPNIFQLKVLDANTGVLKWQVSHSSLIFNLVYSPDGKKIITGSWDNTIKIWAADNGTLLWTGYHQSYIKSLAISPDAKFIASGSADKSIKIWDAETGNLLWQGFHSSNVLAVNFSPDGSRIISGEEGKQYKVWNTKDGSVVFNGIVQGMVSRACFNHDGSRFAIGTNIPSGYVRLYSSTTGELLSISPPMTAINSMGFSPDGKKILTSVYQQAHILDANTGQIVWTGQKSHVVWDSKFSADGKTFVTGSWDDSVHVWHFSKQIVINSFQNTEKIMAKTTQKIKWTSKNVSSVKLEYTTDNGTNWISIANSITASLGEYNWLVPSVESTQCKIRITDVEEPTIVNTIASSFEIYRPLKILSPIGGEVWQAGTYQDIKWINKTTSVLTIEYSLDNGASWYVINNTVQPTINNFKWIVPNHNSSQCKIKIYDPNDLVNKYESPATFDIFQSLKITSPNGGEVLFTKKTKQITWKNISTDLIRILFTTDFGTSWTLIADSINASDGKYYWVVPAITSDKAKITIMDNSNSNVYDDSDDFFTIVQPSIIVTNPTGGETLMANSKCEISWLSQHVDNIKIEYTTDNGIIWSKIAESISAADKKYTWKVPNIFASKARIRISDAFDYETKGESKGSFSVYLAPELSIFSPNGGEVLKAGKESKILWMGTNSSNIAIYYSTNNGSSWILICDSTSAFLGQYNWTIPSLTSTKCRVKVVDKLFPEVFDLSDTTFSIIQPSITVLSPNGGEKWMANTKNDITWSSSFVNKMNIDFSTDNGKTWIYVDENVASENKKYTWSTHDVVGEKFRIRISDSADMLIFGMSEKPFSITPFVGIDDKESSTIPTKYALHQNYPNPFNPETTISYSIPKGEHVTLKVFDLLGREVATLVDEYKQAGTYKTTFNVKTHHGVSLQSGVYFYKLQSSSCSETKKLILMK